MHWYDVLDIILVAFLIYQLYYLLKGTVAIRIFLGVGSIYLIWKLVEAFQMKMLGEVLGQFIGVGVIALLIVFQQELRRFLLMIGNTDFFMRNRSKGAFKFLFGDEKPVEMNIVELLKTVYKLAGRKTGALIVIAHRSDPSMYIRHGVELNADISGKLVESIFHKESPLHDGAVLIRNNKILRAGCVLPVSEGTHALHDIGMRHRSALGISEKAEVLVIVVSEETGKVSLAKNGVLLRNLSQEELKKKIEEAFE